MITLDGNRVSKHVKIMNESRQHKSILVSERFSHISMQRSVQAWALETAGLEASTSLGGLKVAFLK